MTFRDRTVTIHDAPAPKELGGYESPDDGAVVIENGRTDPARPAEDVLRDLRPAPGSIWRRSAVRM